MERMARTWLSVAVVCVAVCVLLCGGGVSGGLAVGSFVSVGSGAEPEVGLVAEGGASNVVVAFVAGPSGTTMYGRDGTSGGALWSFVVCGSAGCATKPSATYVPGAGGSMVAGQRAADGKVVLFFCSHSGPSCVDRSSALPALPNDSGHDPSSAVNGTTVYVAAEDRSGGGGGRVRVIKCEALGVGPCTSAVADTGAPAWSGAMPALVVLDSAPRAVVFSRDVVDAAPVNASLRVWTFDTTAMAGSSELHLTTPFSGYFADALVLPGSGPVRSIAVAAEVRASGNIEEIGYYVYESTATGASVAAEVDVMVPVSDDVGPVSLALAPEGYVVVVATLYSGGRESHVGWRVLPGASTAVLLNMNAGLALSEQLTGGRRSSAFVGVANTIVSIVSEVDNGGVFGLFVQPMADTPAGVTSATRVAFSKSSVTVVWDKPITFGLPVLSYTVEYALGPNLAEHAMSVSVAPLAGGAGMVTVSNLTAFSEVSMVFRAVTAAGTAPATPVHVFWSAPGAPQVMAAPYLLDATSSHIEISWSPAADSGDPILFYELFVSPPGTVLLVGNPNDFRHTLTGLSADTEYTISIRATNANGTAPFSPVLAVSTDTINISPPDAPPRPAASSITSASLQLDWLQPADNNLPITSYSVFQTPPSAVVATVATTFAHITGLSPNQGYFFTVTATNGNGTSPASPALAVTTATINAPPETPAGASLAASPAPTSDSVSVTWLASPPNLADPPSGYDVKVVVVAIGVDTTGVAPVTVFSVPSGSVFEYTVTGLLPASTYDVSVAARNANGTSPFTAPVRVTTPAAPPDAPEAGVVAGIGVREVNLTFTLPMSNGAPVTELIVYRNGDQVASVVGDDLIKPPPIEFSDAGLSPVTLYVYTAVAVNSAGASEASPPLSVQTDAEPPEPVVAPLPPPESNTVLLASLAGVGAVLLCLVAAVVFLLCRRKRAKARAGPPMPDFEPYRFGKYGTTPVKASVASRVAEVETLLPFIFDHPSMAVLNAMLVAVDAADADEFARSLLAVAMAKGKEKEVILAACALEVERASSLSTLFRVNSVATKLMQAYSKAVGLPYMWEAVGRHVAVWYHEQHVADEDGGDGGGGEGLSVRSFEIDTTKVDAGTAETNKYLLMAMCQQFFESIVASGKFVPVGMRRICLYLQNAVSAKFPTVGSTPTNSYIFLRFLNPAISAPEAFGVVPAPPTRDERRQLILVTKVLQNLANGVLFGTKERFMVQLNPFLTTNGPRLNGFVRDILDINVPSFDPFPPASEMPPSVLPLSLGVLHGYFVALVNKAAFKDALKDQPPLPGFEVLPDLASSSSSSSYSSSSSSSSSSAAAKPAASAKAPLLPPPPPALAPRPIALDGIELDAIDPAGASDPYATPGFQPNGPDAAFAVAGPADFSLSDEAGGGAPVKHGHMLFNQFRMAVAGLGQPMTRTELFPTKKR